MALSAIAAAKVSMQPGARMNATFVSKRCKFGKQQLTGRGGLKRALKLKIQLNLLKLVHFAEQHRLNIRLLFYEKNKKMGNSFARNNAHLIHECLKKWDQRLKSSGC